MKNSKHPCKAASYFTANVAYLLSGPSVSSLPLASGCLTSRAKHSERVVSIQDLHIPVGQPLDRFSTLPPRAVVLDKPLSACLLRIRSWNPLRLKRQTPPPHRAGERSPHSSISLSGLSVACENVDFLLAALHWQKGS